MGLDMYLTKRTYVKNWEFHKPEERHKVTVMKAGKVVSHIQPERIREIVEDIAYWRKANEIHQWFVDNCQDGRDDCQVAYVSREKLSELLAVVNDILAEPIETRIELAKQTLPTQSGFFFGGTEYDAYYWQDLADTKVKLTLALNEPENECDFYYQSSW